MFVRSFRHENIKYDMMSESWINSYRHILFCPSFSEEIAFAILSLLLSLLLLLLYTQTRKWLLYHIIKSLIFLKFLSVLNNSLVSGIYTCKYMYYWLSKVEVRLIYFSMLSEYNIYFAIIAQIVQTISYMLHGTWYIIVHIYS